VHTKITESGSDEQRKFELVLNKDPSAFYEPALRNLTELLNHYHKKRVIVLIDEHDVPVNDAYLHGYYEKALRFLTSSFTGALKDNSYACVTIFLA